MNKFNKLTVTAYTNDDLSHNFSFAIEDDTFLELGEGTDEFNDFIYKLEDDHGVTFDYYCDDPHVFFLDMNYFDEYLDPADLGKQLCTQIRDQFAPGAYITVEVLHD